MRRSPIVAILMAALLVSGCASQPAILIPPGVDRNELMEAIARSGQADPEVGPAVPAERDRLTPLLEPCLVVAGKLTVTCLILGALFGLAVASHGGGNLNGSGLGKLLGDIWAAD